MKPSYYSLGFNPLKPTAKTFCAYWWKDVFNPKKYYNFIKHFCQRGYRGYADCDHWSADGYLEEVMIGVLTDLKKHVHGYPNDLTPELWDSILEEIIEGLKASQDIKNEDSIQEDLVYPTHGEPLKFKDLGNGFSEMVHESDEPSFVTEEYDKWKKPLEAKRLRAAHLLTKYWVDLWD